MRFLSMRARMSSHRNTKNMSSTKLEVPAKESRYTGWAQVRTPQQGRRPEVKTICIAIVSPLRCGTPKGTNRLVPAQKSGADAPKSDARDTALCAQLTFNVSCFSFPIDSTDPERQSTNDVPERQSTLQLPVHLFFSTARSNHCEKLTCACRTRAQCKC